MPTTKKKLTNAQLTAKWRKFVESVESGYSFGLYDYRNDLDVRSLIADASRTPTETVAELDRRFLAATTKRKLKVWESDSANPFWIFGIPRKSCPEFKQDLKVEGLL